MFWGAKTLAVNHFPLERGPAIQKALSRDFLTFEMPKNLDLKVSTVSFSKLKEMGTLKAGRMENMDKFSQFFSIKLQQVNHEHHEPKLSQMQRKMHDSLIHFSVVGLEQHLNQKNYQFQLGL